MDKIMEQPPAVGGELPVDDDQTLADSGFYWRETGGVKVLVCRALEDAGFANGFSTRVGGVSAFPENSLNLAGFDDDTAENIYENRRRFLTAFDGEYELALALQVHGSDIRVVRTREDVGDSERHADAVISDLANVLAGAKTADCVPVLIGDRVTKAFAAVHAGWKGTVRSIVKVAAEKMNDVYGSKPSDLIAAIGPAACGRNYEIGREVIDQFSAKFENAQNYFTPTRDGHALVDLHAANRDQLIAAGIEPGRIFTAPFCTMERSDLFFSYRREKGDFGKTGRLLSVIGRAC
jgi:YfiH family protein